KVVAKNLFAIATAKRAELPLIAHVPSPRAARGTRSIDPAVLGTYLKSRDFQPTARRLSRPTGFLLNSWANPHRIPSTETGLGRFRDHGGAMTAATQEVASLPDMKVSIRQLFGFDSDMEVPAYSAAYRGAKARLPITIPDNR